MGGERRGGRVVINWEGKNTTEEGITTGKEEKRRVDQFGNSQVC